MNATATLSDLTKRELEVTELLALGASKKEIATKLFISERTVENHARSIYQKVGVSKVSELSAWFISTKYNIPGLSSHFEKLVVVLVVFLALLFSTDIILSVSRNQHIIQAEAIRCFITATNMDKLNKLNIGLSYRDKPM